MKYYIESRACWQCEHQKNKKVPERKSQEVQCLPPPPPTPTESGGAYMYTHSPSPKPPYFGGKRYTPYLGYWLPLAITQKNTPIPALAQDIFPRLYAQKYPFPDKIETYLRLHWRGDVYIRSSLQSCIYQKLREWTFKSTKIQNPFPLKNHPETRNLSRNQTLKKILFLFLYTSTPEML